MTIEEAIKILKGAIKKPNTKDGYLGQALDMAIKALEQQPCEDWYDVPSDEMTLEQARQAVKDLRKKVVELLVQVPCKDAISREAVLDKICNVDGMEGFENSNIFAKHYVNVIKALPPVTPQPKTGHWIDVEVLDSALWHKCSKCGETEFYATDYCPNCGAKMEVEE